MRKKLTFWPIFLTIVALIIVSANVYAFYQSFSSFKALVADPMKGSEVAEIRITRSHFEPDEKEVVITDKRTIDRIMNNFADIKLKSTNRSPLESTNYEIWIETSKYHTFFIFLSDQNIMSISPDGSISNKKYSANYRITNHYDNQVIEDLFK